jgi:hypothetical protein
MTEQRERRRGAHDRCRARTSTAPWCHPDQCEPGPEVLRPATFSKACPSDRHQAVQARAHRAPLTRTPVRNAAQVRTRSAGASSGGGATRPEAGAAQSGGRPVPPCGTKYARYWSRVRPTPHARAPLHQLPEQATPIGVAPRRMRQEPAI